MNDIPYIVYEGAMARHERQLKRLIIALIVSIVLIFASNAIWLYAWCQYDYSSEEITYSQDGMGLNNINTGIQGGITNGPKDDSKETE
jgi:membrane protein YdbS with pleckstrin-like domain